MSEAPQLHVSVALPVALDKEFTYRLASGAEGVLPGMRVLVPFGRRRLTGIVTRVGVEPDLDASQIRDVESVLDAIPTIPGPLLELARFVSDYYICPIGEVLRSMHAGGPTGDLMARITDAGRLALAGAARGQRQQGVLAALQEKERPLSSLQRRGGAGPGLGAGIVATVQQLVERGWVELRPVLAGGGQDASVVVFRRATESVGGASPDAARIGPAGQRILDLLSHAADGLAAGELAEATERGESSVRQALARLERAGMVVRAERAIRRAPDVLRPRGPTIERVLSAAQHDALVHAKSLVDAKAFGVLLIEGVTGSGKTEIYLRALAHVIATGGTGLYLVPEIAITPLLMRVVRERLGERTAILHSELSAGERHDERARILAGEVDVVLGARSAVFAPIPRLRLIVVDEEHEGSYKQDSQPRYHARDVAIVRASIEGAAVVLGSATPSLESYQNTRDGRHALRRLPERVGGARTATVELIDMRDEWRAERGASPLSRALRESLAATLAAGHQAMILLNRRGWADFVLCRECGEPERCDRCAVTLTVHLKTGTLLCHYCDARRDIPAACRSCNGTFLQNVGQGTEQVEEALRSILPGVPIGRLDRDVARRKGAAAAILAEFEAGNLKVLLGTQMIAKGHDFPNVTLVGVLQADRALFLPDFRAAERTFQLLVQVAGRAGRGVAAGRVLIQTHSPEHPAIISATTQDYPRFFEAEASHRQALGYPPFRRLIALLVSGQDVGAARDAADRLGEALRAEVGSQGVVLGPAVAPIARIKDRFRFQILVKGPGRRALNDAVRRAMARQAVPADLRVEVDVDPQSLL